MKAKTASELLAETLTRVEAARSTAMADRAAAMAAGDASAARAADKEGRHNATLLTALRQFAAAPDERARARAAVLVADVATVDEYYADHASQCVEAAARALQSGDVGPLRAAARAREYSHYASPPLAYFVALAVEAYLTTGEPVDALYVVDAR